MPAPAQNPEADLVQDILGFEKDPLTFVKYAFPWGSGELEGQEILDWQAEYLDDVGRRLRAQGSREGVSDVIRKAVASGHGIGKSALVAWLILWAMSTFPDTKGVVTANTESQLKGKTWAELGKWYRLAINKHWFKFTATALFAADPEYERTWRIEMAPWSERNTEAFAGLHNQGKRLLVVFDEASAIPDLIHEVTEGALTDKGTQIIWAQFGNPTRPEGRFHDCFGLLRHRWSPISIDSRSVPITNKEQIQEWIDDYGDDSDFVRVRVKGEFPRTGSSQFIPTDVVEDAMRRDRWVDDGAPLIMGIDVARFGEDRSTIVWRKGDDAVVVPWEEFRGMDLMALSSICADRITTHQPEAIFVDGTGVGGGVVDRLNQLGHGVIDVQSGSRATDDVRFANKRAEMWSNMREWLRRGALPDSRDLKSELVGIEYGYDNRGRYQLEKKSDLKKRGQPSPDLADALSLTFAEPVGRTDLGDWEDDVRDDFSGRDDFTGY